MKIHHQLLLVIQYITRYGRDMRAIRDWPYPMGKTA